MTPVYNVAFIQDLAVIMLIAGVVTIFFHRLKQPVVLGYMLAGVIIGPHTPPFALIHDAVTVNTLIAAYRKLHALGRILSERAAGPESSGDSGGLAGAVIKDLIPALSIMGMLVLIFVLSVSILPPLYLLILVLFIVAVITVLLWKKFILIHAKLQGAFKDVLDESQAR